MSTPNLFDYATKEISQDEVICWLLAWAGAAADKGPGGGHLRRCGRALMQALFSKWDGRGDFELGGGRRLEVLQAGHGAHHSFDGVKRRHIRITTWRKGVKGSGRNRRYPIPFC